MKRMATTLAAQMTAASITPQNVAQHAAYTPPQGGGPALLAYALDDHNRPVLGQWACSLHQSGDDWLLWDDHGARHARIVYNAGQWRVA